MERTKWPVISIKVKPGSKLRLSKPRSSEPRAEPKKRSSIKLPDKIMRINPFLITDRELSSNGSYVKTYGYHGDRIVTYGRLFEQDRGVLSAILSIIGETGKIEEIKITSIAKHMGYKNPRDRNTKENIKESIRRLLDAQLKLYERDGSGKRKLSARFVFLEGRIDDDTALLSVSNFINVIRDLCLGYFYINLKTYFKLSSPIARSLYVFLSSQKGPYYQAGLNKLCEFINYNPDIPVWRRRAIVKKQLNVLKQENIIGNFKINIRREEKDGGLVIISQHKKESGCR